MRSPLRSGLDAIEQGVGDRGDRLAAIKRSAIERGRPQQGRVDVVLDGRVRSFEVTATPRRDEHGRIVGVLSVAVDLTDVLRTHERHHPMHARLTGILGWVPGSGAQTLGVCIISYDGVVRVGFKADASAVPDPEKLVHAFDDEMDTLVRLAAAV